jgi:predicted nucleic acid-binding protein
MNVLISGLIYSTSKPDRSVRFWRDSRFELVISRQPWAERPRVMTYPKLARVLRWKRNGIERLLKHIYIAS